MWAILQTLKYGLSSSLSMRIQHYSKMGRRREVNTILKGCIQSNSPTKAFSVFRILRRKESVPIDSFTLLILLKACTRPPSVRQGKQIHALMVSLGFEPILILRTTLIRLYSATGNFLDALRVFDELPNRNVVCWTALISAYIEGGKPGKALACFRQMQAENIEPDRVTITTVLCACANLGALDMGEWIHAYICRTPGFKTDLSLDNALINMYAKCGDIETSRRLFDRVSQRDITTWTSMIVGHAIHGQAMEALRLFAKLKDARDKLIIPNEVTFVGVLMACSHAGLVDKGLQYLGSMSKEYGLKPRISHYGCMVDLFCRAGLLKEAMSFIADMPIQPNAVVWRTLLGACSLHGNVELGVYARERLLELEPNYMGDHVTISNTYAAAGLWAEKSMAREMSTKWRRTPACSLIEVESRINEFVTAKGSDPHMGKMYDIPEECSRNLSHPKTLQIF